MIAEQGGDGGFVLFGPVADNLTGKTAEFPGILGTAVTRVFDLVVARTGLGLKDGRDHGLELEKVAVESRSRAHYYPGGSVIKTVLLVDKGSRKLWGAQMAGKDGVAQRNGQVTAITEHLKC